MAAGDITLSRFRTGIAEFGFASIVAVLRPAHWLLSNTSFLYLGALVAMLFRPPDLKVFNVDRIAFVLLLSLAFLRKCLDRGTARIWSATSIPMLALAVLTSASTFANAYEAQAWSMWTAKFLVPFALFHVAQLTFIGRRSFQRFETFALVVLAYLTFIAIAWLCRAEALIYPKYILDTSLGIHADRARGPFLQAVANGVSLNILGLVAFNSFRRQRLRRGWAVLIFTALPVAILATMTRAVWISFAASLVAVTVISDSRRLHRCCSALLIIGLGVVAMSFTMEKFAGALSDRAEESGPVEIRMAVYRASWEMIREKPLLGWGQNQMPTELAHRMSDYHLDTYWAHNTYLELLMEEGLLGLALYTWIIVALFRLGRVDRHAGDRETLFDSEFRRLWPVMLGVYLVNASFVVMNYQFVNALLFTLAGILAGQKRRATCASDVFAS